MLRAGFCCCALQITVLNAKGIVIKPLSPAPAAVSNQQQQQLPSSFSGAHMEVGEQVLAAGLPLNPGGSVSLPVAVTVGKPPGDAFDAVMLQVCDSRLLDFSCKSGQSLRLGYEGALPHGLIQHAVCTNM